MLRLACADLLLYYLPLSITVAPLLYFQSLCGLPQLLVGFRLQLTIFEPDRGVHVSVRLFQHFLDSFLLLALRDGYELVKQGIKLLFVHCVWNYIFAISYQISSVQAHPSSEQVTIYYL